MSSITDKQMKAYNNLRWQWIAAEERNRRDRNASAAAGLFALGFVLLATGAAIIAAVVVLY